MDANGVLARVFDKANGRLNVTQVGGISSIADTGTTDENGVWAAAYDPATNTLRVIVVP